MAFTAPALTAPAFTQPQGLPPCGWNGVLCEQCGKHGGTKKPHTEGNHDPSGLDHVGNLVRPAMTCGGGCGMCRNHCILQRLKAILSFVDKDIAYHELLYVLGHRDGVQSMIETLSTIRDTTEITDMIRRSDMKEALKGKIRKLVHLLEGSLNEKKKGKKVV